MRVLGMDPGLTRCGLGVVEGRPGRAELIEVGVARTPASHDLGARLVALEEVAGPDRHGVAARLELGGRRLAPALVEVEQLGPRADVATASSPSREVQAALVSTDGEGTAVVSISTTPGAWWVWGGGLLLAAGGLVEAATRRGRRVAQPSGQPEAALERPGGGAPSSCSPTES